ncbi:MAG: hypothetical protein WDN76_02700 [Alphaproteobacteria bacterium]
MGILLIFPLLTFPAVVYALLAATHGAGVTDYLATQVFSIDMAGGGKWVLTHGHLYIIFAILCLFIEIIKSVRPTTQAMIDLSLSVGLFVILLIVFILVPGFGTTEFFLIMLMSILDFMAGAIVMVSSAKRTVEYDRH